MHHEATGALLVDDGSSDVKIVSEEAFLVFDPLATSQTTLVRFKITGATKPFGVLIPVAQKAQVSFGHIRSFSQMTKQVRPTATANRNIQVNVTSWVGSCLVPEVGREPTTPPDVEKRRLKASTSTALKTENHSRAWLMERGFSLAPGQVSWMRELRAQGWTFLAIMITPPPMDDPSETLLSPIITYTHSTNYIAYNIHQPPISLLADRDYSKTPLNVAVLTEWPVGPETQNATELVVSQPITSVRLRRMARRARGLPWGFRRDGHLTAYSLKKRSTAGILRFTRMDSLPRKKPYTKQEDRLVNIDLPVEVILFAGWLTVWAWRGRGQGRRVRGRRVSSRLL
jgi:hypothetical protein